MKIKIALAKYLAWVILAVLAAVLVYAAVQCPLQGYQLRQAERLRLPGTRKPSRRE